MGGRGYGDGGRGRLYTYHYTATTRMTSALRCAAMRVILMFRNCEGQSHKTVSSDHNFWTERRAEADSNRGPSAYQPNALPLGQTGSLIIIIVIRAHMLIRQGHETLVLLDSRKKATKIAQSEASSHMEGRTKHTKEKAERRMTAGILSK